MPIFLIHGFKWARVPIREHVVINSVLDASPDYLMSSTSSAAMRASLEMAHPNIMKRIPNIHFVEQYDPEDEATSHAQPYAFVADKVIQSDLNINLREANIQNYIDPVYADAFFELRDVLVGEKVEMGWYMVFNGDPERSGCKTMAQGWENEELEKEMVSL